jgi:hypothetical protein
MKLDAWLQQDRPLAERLRVIERLSQAVNEFHNRGEALAALEPGRIELESDGTCDLSAARRGSPAAGYSAPERAEGGPPSPSADVYAAGAIAWEILVGRPAGDSPAPLTEASPDVPREIAEAVMGCLERSPEWRPKDLTYLAQIAGAQQTSGRRAPPAPARRVPGPSRPSPARAPARRPSRSHGPLIAAAGLVLVGAAAGVWWYQRQASEDRTRTAPTARNVSPAPRVATPAPAATSAAPTPAPVPTAGPKPTPGAATPTPTPLIAAAHPTPAATSVPPTPAPLARATPQPTPTPPTVATPRPTPTPAPATPTPAPAEPVVARATPESAQPPPTAAPEIPATLTAVSPLTVRRPGKVLLDVRGTGLRPEHRAKVVPVKEMPHGITIARQKYVNDTLLTILLELDPTVSPGAYALVLENQRGPLTNQLTFTVTK